MEQPKKRRHSSKIKKIIRSKIDIKKDDRSISNKDVSNIILSEDNAINISN